jgi:predicted SAM-dependent methyltransferase
VSDTQQVVLSVGAGGDMGEYWEGHKVVRLDIDPATNPDIVASMTDMGDIGPFDVVYCCHSLEHLYPHDVPRALSEFYRVLRPGGSAVILVPDLEGVSPTDDELPNMGGLSGLHLFYGDARLIEAMPYMAHHSGFVEKTLKECLEQAGFTVLMKRMEKFNLLGIGKK